MDVLDSIAGKESNACQEITCAYPLDPGIQNARVVSGGPHCGQLFLNESERGWGQPCGGSLERLDDRSRVGGVRQREVDTKMEWGQDGEGSRERRCVGGCCEGGVGEIGVVWDLEDVDGCVDAEFDGDEKRDDRVLVGDADRRVDRLGSVRIGGDGENEDGHKP